MAATKRDAEIDRLRERVEELERQVVQLKAAGVGPRSALPAVREMTEAEAQAFHESSERILEDIRKEREKDRAKINREMDRRERLEKARAAKAARPRAKVRKAG